MNTNRTSRTAHPSHGFTLIELLVAMGIGAVVLTLAAGAIRQFWLVQSLEGAADELVTQLRQEQENAISETFPYVFGARFSVGSSDWTLFRFDPGPLSSTTDDTCEAFPRSFVGGVFTAGVVVSSVSITNDASAPEHVSCRAAIPDQIMFFYARGTSTGGSIALTQPNTGRSETVSVSTITGRVTRT